MFKPRFKIVVKTFLVIVDEDGRSDVHGIYEDKSFLNSALAKAVLHLGSNVDE